MKKILQIMACLGLIIGSASISTLQAQSQPEGSELQSAAQDALRKAKKMPDKDTLNRALAALKELQAKNIPLAASKAQQKDMDELMADIAKASSGKLDAQRLQKINEVYAAVKKRGK